VILIPSTFANSPNGLAFPAVSATNGRPFSSDAPSMFGPDELIVKFSDAPDLLTVDEVATLLRIGRNHAYELCRTGDLPSVKLGRRIVVPKAMLQVMLQVMLKGDAATRGDS
jgi:excisionase family DNA binding protein